MTGEDADCSHWRCETRCRAELAVNEIRTNGRKEGERRQENELEACYLEQK